jgi:hypothetical protein
MVSAHHRVFPTSAAVLGPRGMVLSTMLTFYWVCISYVFFRAHPIRNEKTGELIASVFDITGTIAKSFILFQRNGTRSFDDKCFLLFAAFVVVHWLGYRGYLATWWRRIPDWVYAALLGLGVAARSSSCATLQAVHLLPVLADCCRLGLGSTKAGQKRHQVMSRRPLMEVEGVGG